MRVARLVASLNMDLDPEEQWVLVLPPWGPLYHWRSKDVGSQIRIKWKEFFDINSLAAYVPVMELEDFREARTTIDKVFYLQHYPSTFSSTTWDEKYEEAPCLEDTQYYYEEDDGLFSGWFWGYPDVSSKQFACLSVQGSASTLKPLLQGHSNYTSDEA